MLSGTVYLFQRLAAPPLLHSSFLLVLPPPALLLLLLLLLPFEEASPSPSASSSISPTAIEQIHPRRSFNNYHGEMNWRLAALCAPC